MIGATTDILSYTTGVLAFGSAWLLIGSGLGHMRHLDRLRAALVTQRLTPARWHRLIAVCLVMTELAVGTSCLVLIPLGPPWSTVSLTALTTILLGLTGYVAILLVLRPSAACGCFGDGTPATIVKLSRNATLTVFTGAAWLFSSPIASGSPLEAALLIAAAVPIAVLAYTLPAALHLRRSVAASASFS